MSQKKSNKNYTFKENDLSLSSSSSTTGDNTINYREFHKERIKRDLNSPSANARLRAIKAIKNPHQNFYLFDVPSTFQEIVTEEERATPAIYNAPFKEVMKDVVLYVNVYDTIKKNISNNMKNKFIEMGLTVSDKFTKNVTHVVFHCGTQAVYNKAKKLGIPVVPVLWIGDCERLNRKIHPGSYQSKICDYEKYENARLKPKSAGPKFIYKIKRDIEKNIKRKLFSNVDDYLEGSDIDDFDLSETQRNKSLLNINNQTIYDNVNMDETLHNKRYKSISNVSKLEYSLTNSLKITGKSQRKTTYDNKSMDVSMIKNKSTINEIITTSEKEMNSKNEPKTIRKRKLFVPDLILTPETVDETISTNINDKEKIEVVLQKENNSTNESKVIHELDKTAISKNEMVEEHVYTSKPLKEKQTSKVVNSEKKKRRNTSMDFIDIKQARLTQQQTQSQFIGKKLNSPKIMVCTSVKDVNQLKTVKEAIKNLGGFILQRIVTDRTTHLICFETRKTMNVFRAMIRGLWILNDNWINDSMVAGKWLYEEEYEIVDPLRTIQINRSQREAFGKTFKMELFESLKSFCVSPKCNEITHDMQKNIIELINLCGGKIVDDPKEANFIIGEYFKINDNNEEDDNKNNDVENQTKLCLKTDWITDSIAAHRLKKYHKYLLKENGT